MSDETTNTNEVRTGRCAHCGAYFEWTPNGPRADVKLYCKPTHARSAARKARNLRDERGTSSCPTPGKRAYAHTAEAMRALRDQQPVVQGARPYLCSCGKFHIGRLAPTYGGSE